MLYDTLGRTVRYLRLSVTDRCNLRCGYCRGGYERFIPHEQVLRYEEFLRIIRLSVSLGIEKVRLTGGEPFVRKHFMRFLEQIRHEFPTLDIRLTSNATLIEPYAQALADLGLNRVNLSLDTFQRKRFEHITGRDMLPAALRGIDALLARGVPIKLNAVAMKGVNSDELPDFLTFAQQHAVDVRFIEYMPMGEAAKEQRKLFWAAHEILTAAEALVSVEPVAEYEQHAGPATLYTIAGGKGRLGLISAMSQHFCEQCNRLRITSDGHLRTCLFSDTSYNLRGVLRHPRLGDTNLRKVVLASNRRKPLGHSLLQDGVVAVANDRMTGIGG